MNHLTAASRQDGAGWHYVSLGRHGGHPIGACREHPPHATEQEARECYGAHLRASVSLEQGTQWSSCDVTGCPEPARTVATIDDGGYAAASLCEQHANAERAIEVLQLAGPAGDAWVS